VCGSLLSVKAAVNHTYYLSILPDSTHPDEENATHGSTQLADVIISIFKWHMVSGAHVHVELRNWTSNLL